MKLCIVYGLLKARVFVLFSHRDDTESTNTRYPLLLLHDTQHLLSTPNFLHIFLNLAHKRLVKSKIICNSIMPWILIDNICGNPGKTGPIASDSTVFPTFPSFWGLYYQDFF